MFLHEGIPFWFAGIVTREAGRDNRRKKEFFRSAGVIIIPDTGDDGAPRWGREKEARTPIIKLFRLWLTLEGEAAAAWEAQTFLPRLVN